MIIRKGWELYLRKVVPSPQQPVYFNTSDSNPTEFSIRLGRTAKLRRYNDYRVVWYPRVTDHSD